MPDPRNLRNKVIVGYATQEIELTFDDAEVARQMRRVLEDMLDNPREGRKLQARFWGIKMRRL